MTHAQKSASSVEAAVRIGCTAADIHLTCSYPECTCKQIPSAVRAVMMIAAAERDELRAINADLLAALKALAGLDRTPDRHARPEILNARAAIAKAKAPP